MSGTQGMTPGSLLLVTILPRKAVREATGRGYWQLLVCIFVVEVLIALAGVQDDGWKETGRERTGQGVSQDKGWLDRRDYMAYALLSIHGR